MLFASVSKSTGMVPPSSLMVSRTLRPTWKWGVGFAFRHPKVTFVGFNKMV